MRTSIGPEKSVKLKSTEKYNPHGKLILTKKPYILDNRSICAMYFYARKRKS